MLRYSCDMLDILDTKDNLLKHRQEIYYFACRSFGDANAALLPERYGISPVVILQYHTRSSSSRLSGCYLHTARSPLHFALQGVSVSLHQNIKPVLEIVGKPGVYTLHPYFGRSLPTMSHTPDYRDTKPTTTNMLTRSEALERAVFRTR